MVGQTVTAKGRPYDYKYYRCRHIYNKSTGSECTSNRIRGEWLEEAVWREVQRVLTDPQIVLQELEHLGADEGDTQEVERLETVLADLKKQEGRLVVGGEGPAEGKGYFIQPTVFADIASDARLSREEVFGPVLAMTKARDFDEAIAFANDTDFGLTGSVFTNNDDHQKKAAAEFHVGNLYFNRGCTGALVGAHPFGGFNMSGTDSKAGGSDYLLLFLQAKTISRKL